MNQAIAKVTVANGESWKTRINGTDEEIRRYFAIGTRFNVGSFPIENMQPVTKVEIIR